MSPGQVVKDIWEDRLKRRLAMAASALAAILTVMHIGSVAEPHWIATRQFARDLVERTEMTARDRDIASTRRIISTEIAIKESDRRAVQRDIDRVRAEFQRLPASAPDTLRELLNDQMRTYVDQLRLLDYDLDDLRRQQSSRRP